MEHNHLEIEIFNKQMKLTMLSVTRKVGLCLVLLLLTGCASNSKQDDGIIGNIPPTSKFAKLSIGMSFRHVIDLIGIPTETKTYSTGKVFIPFYFGSDVIRQEALYKGEGRITYTGGALGSVYRIVYDPTEDGYADK